MTLPKNDAGGKIRWQGVLLSVQPRIRLTRPTVARLTACLTVKHRPFLKEEKVPGLTPRTRASDPISRP